MRAPDDAVAFPLLAKGSGVHLARPLLAAIVVLTSAGAGYVGSRIWPLPTSYSFLMHFGANDAASAGSELKEDDPPLAAQELKSAAATELLALREDAPPPLPREAKSAATTELRATREDAPPPPPQEAKSTAATELRTPREDALPPPPQDEKPAAATELRAPKEDAPPPFARESKSAAAAAPSASVEVSSPSAPTVAARLPETTAAIEGQGISTASPASSVPVLHQDPTGPAHAEGDRAPEAVTAAGKTEQGAAARRKVASAKMFRHARAQRASGTEPSVVEFAPNPRPNQGLRDFLARPSTN
jgi:hypothetical protein